MNAYKLLEWNRYKFCNKNVSFSQVTINFFVENIYGLLGRNLLRKLNKGIKF